MTKLHFTTLTAVVLHLFLPLLLINNNAVATAQENKEYTRYAKYHPYCGTPEQMQQRSIPPLQYETNSSSSIAPQLLHVTAIIRHGARTPYAGPPSYQCWHGYWSDPSTSVWDCDLKTYTAPPSTDKSKMITNVEYGLLRESPDFLFEKNYDALLYGSTGNSTGNELNGTCQLGQLLMRGYDQELQNG